ncbi:metal ABC transporter solute-binding protein, Zn/Mn family [Bacillus sp. V33-4]|uniref:metal ABC transporter solute-binding protein, Zn/Mn family n=1 Tax=Bacillus sp. V33-4 TaxID=2054169 RepID=UPI000C79490F|nr:zinc ABC transporter substrate-binding protein [Bacillus sp. V33-4]PLR86970.1 adhesin [Bacillus sp. V33-4]
MKKLLVFISILLPISIFLSGCNNKETPEQGEDQALKLYTTVYPLQYFTERIGGKYVDVKTIYPPGADEHTFEPSQKDMLKLAEADAFIYIGLGLEGFVEKAKHTLENEKVTLVAAGDHVDLNTVNHDHVRADNDEHSDDSQADHSKADSHSHGDDSTHTEENTDSSNQADDHGHDHDIDPHVWLDPLYSIELAEAVKEVLTEKLPEQESLFQENFDKLAGELDELHHEFEKVAETASHREMIVSHAAYGYWETRYGIEQLSISGLSTASEPTQRDLEQIIALADQHGLQYILTEQNVSSKFSEIVQKEIGAETMTLHNLSTLTEKDIKAQETYLTIMQKNLQTLEKALNG